MQDRPHKLESRFADFLRTSGLVKRGDSVLVAVSGGIDSMVLLKLFLLLREEWKLELGIVHVNHQLRGAESDEDEAFVRSTAKSAGLPLFAERVDTLAYAHRHRFSKQEAAREIRYEFFERIRQERGVTSVATAHQANDNAETILLNVLRGAGIRGMCGIPLRRENAAVIRPLLFAHRSEIEEYASAHRVEFRSDSSNESPEYRRNYLRKSVLPLLSEDVHPDIVGALNRLAATMRRLDERISREVQARWNEVVQRDERGNVAVAIRRLAAEPSFLQEAIVMQLLRMLHHDVEADKVGAILGLCALPTGRSLQLTGTTSVFRDRDRLVFVESTGRQQLSAPIALGETFYGSGFSFTMTGPFSRPERLGSDRTTEYVDAERLGRRLVLRSWQDGDWFIPLGMQTRKKLSDFFADEKVPVYEKDSIPILESEGEIVWICGRRLDDRFKITKQTKSVIRLDYQLTLSTDA